MNPSRKAPSFKVFPLLWFILLVFQGMYAFILALLARPAEGAGGAWRWFPNLRDPFEAIVTALGVGLVVVAVLVPAAMAQAMEKPRKDGREEKFLAAEKTVSGLLPVFIVRLAILESVCILGFALAMTKHSPGVIAPFLLVSAALYAKNFPANPEKVRSDLGLRG
jgi:hypothetical protein